MTSRLPVAVYLTPGHVLTYVNETWRTLFVGEPPIGIPAREAFLGDGWGVFIDAMDRAWDTGEKQYTPCEDHDSTVVILPLREGDRTVAIVTACRLERVAPMPGARLPSQADPAPRAASLPAELLSPRSRSSDGQAA